MMEWLETLAHSREIPWISAFALGLLTAVSPCPLATNITATAYIARGFRDRQRVLLSGLVYTLGRALSYWVVAILLFYGASKFETARLLQGNGERLLGPLLILIGLLMLNLIRIPVGTGRLTAWYTQKFSGRGLLGALIMGIAFALAFCPYSGALYFGILIPMTIQSGDAFAIPLIFSLGTGIPVILFTYLLAHSMEQVGRWFNILKKVEIVVRKGVGLVFVLVGVYYLWIYWG